MKIKSLVTLFFISCFCASIVFAAEELEQQFKSKLELKEEKKLEPVKEKKAKRKSEKEQKEKLKKEDEKKLDKAEKEKAEDKSGIIAENKKDIMPESKSEQKDSKPVKEKEESKKGEDKKSKKLKEKPEDKQKDLAKDKKTEIEPEPVKEKAESKKGEKNSGDKLQENGEYLIDKIETVIYGTEDTSIITKSDLDRIGLDGQQRTRDGMIFEDLVFQDAKKYNMTDEKMVDKYIEAIQAQQNLSIDDIKKMFHDSGYTYEEGREQLAMYNTINQLMDYKVRSKVIIPEKEVKKYYDENPVWLEEAYKLQRIFVPFASEEQTEQEKEAQKKKIADKLKSKKMVAEADYSEDFWVEKPELAEDKKYISLMKAGQTSTPVAVEDGFEAYKLVERRERQLMPFDQRYREIGEKLREPLYEKLFEDYKQSLFKDAVIVDL